MTCREPGLVLPGDLIAYAAGDADGRIAQHIETCAACAALAAEYAATDQKLGALFRVDCPAPDRLGELALDHLDPRDVLAMNAHLAECPHCTGELAALRAALQGNPLEDLMPAPSLLERIIARLLPDPGTTAAFAGVRGPVSGTSRTYEADGVSISLTLEANQVGGERRWSLLGLVMNEAGDDVPDGANARLQRGGQIAGETWLDEAGNLIFDDLEAGSYNLEVEVAGRTIVVEGIEIGPS